MIISILGAVLLLFVTTLYVLLALGKPYGYLAWGGKYPGVLPKEMRIQTAISIPAQLFAVHVLLTLGGVYSSITTVITVFGYIFMIFFLINVVMNLLSKSRYERFIMTPIAFMISVSFFTVLFLL